MKLRHLFLGFGIFSYLVSFFVYLYFIGFIGNFLTLKTIATPSQTDTFPSTIINISLILIWGLQHSLMAREWFKRFIQPIIPHAIERSFYIFISSATLAIIMMLWQSNDIPIWNVEHEIIKYLLYAIFCLGWVLVFISSFITHHFELFGLRQCWLNFKDQPYTPIAFTQKSFYKWIRHPIMLGFLLVIWATPFMTFSQLIFASGMTLYIFIGIHFEEKGLVQSLGQDYLDYQKATKKLIPRIF